MNILFIEPIWGYEGGIERYVLDCIVEFNRLGHRCSLAYGRQSAKPVQKDLADLLHGIYQLSNLSLFESAGDASEIKHLNTILELEKPDVIFMCEVKNLALLYRLKDYGGLVPMSHASMLVCMRTSNTTYIRRQMCTHLVGYRCFLHGCVVRRSPDQRRRLVLNSVRSQRQLLNVYKSIGNHIVPSNYSKQRLVQHGFTPDQVSVLGLFTNMDPPPPLSLSEPPLISFTGAIHRYKGVDYLLRALKYVTTPFKCSVIGDGEYLPYCKRLARRLGIADVVDFKGWLSTQEIAEQLRTAAVSIVPSIWPEIFGIVGLEAMMCSKPVVAFDAGGISDWLKDGKNGYLVPVKDTKLLAARIEALLKSPRTAVRMGAEGHRLVMNTYNKKQHIEQLLSIFHKAAASRVGNSGASVA